MKLIIPLIFVLFSQISIASEPERDIFNIRVDNHFLAITTGLFIAADWGTTLDIERNYENGYFETNRQMGKYPDRGVINRYFVSKLLLHTFINVFEPIRKYKNIWNGYQFIVSYNAVTHNYNAGLHVNF